MKLSRVMTVRCKGVRYFDVAPFTCTNNVPQFSTQAGANNQQ
jgi:hypothetical protein